MSNASTIRNGWATGAERGQVLVLFTLVLVVICGFASLAIDIGLFFHERQRVQNMVDAAALAGAQNLPDDGPGALAAAQAYAAANNGGATAATVDITFRCLVGDRNADGLPDSGDVPAVCDPGAGSSFNCNNGLCVAQCDVNQGDKCNTIVVSGNKDVPFYFGPVLSLLGGSECFFSQCPTGAIRAAACKGACGGAPTAPLDVIEIIDRTLSMSQTDLDNAKNGARAVLNLFNPEKQRVGLGTLPQSPPGNDCVSVRANEEPGNWVITDLSDNYKNADGTLNPSAEIVSNINCLQLAYQFGLQTNLGTPVKEAKERLIATGRPDTKWGIILMTDGEANVWPATSSGYLSCAANTPVTSGSGDNNGFEQTPGNACADGGGVAADINSGTSTSTSCSNSGKDRHIFYNYNIPDPGSAPIRGIQVRLDARVDSASGTRQLCVELSWNGGASWTSAKTTANLGTSEQTYVLGSSQDTWGRTWSPSDLTNGNFRIRVTSVGSSTSRDFYLDWVAVAVYTASGTSAKGPCDYAVEQATLAKALDPAIEIFTIGFGIAGATCRYELPGSPWAGKTAAEVLAAMATDSADEWGHCNTSSAIAQENADGDHFLCEARSGDLEPIFKQAAETLAGGARLISLPD